MINNQTNRRRFIRSSAFGIIGLTVAGPLQAIESNNKNTSGIINDPIFYRYPSINDDLVSAVVGASHSNLDKVKELVTQRPELACASWDWGFGDAESALGAASHVGRRDIAEFLMSYGARPDIFTMAMMGSHIAVKEMIEQIPGIQSKPGPHGITLLQHAKNRLRAKDITNEDQNNVNKLITYLEKLGNADKVAKSLDLTEEEQKMYFGEYRFGEGENEIFIVDTNSRKLLQISRKGNFGRALNKTDEHIFSPGGAPSVNIHFKVVNQKAVSVTIHEPAPLIVAVRM